ncbi:MAG: OmpH family outer membrane protein [Candidatus Binatia bacterium]
MATISAFRTGLLLLATASVLVAAPASSQDLRAPHPVAYYDVETVVREAHALDPEWQRVAAVEERYVAESASLRAEVNELRTLLGAPDANLSDTQRRVFETQLAQRTIALLVLRTDSMRDVAAAKSVAVGDVDRRIARTVARLAREKGYAVVIRTDADTRVLDDDAVDLTPQVVAELDRELVQTREAVPEPQEPQMDEQRLLRMQTCARDVSVGAACADADAGS